MFMSTCILLAVIESNMLIILASSEVSFEYIMIICKCVGDYPYKLAHIAYTDICMSCVYTIHLI